MVEKQEPAKEPEKPTKKKTEKEKKPEEEPVLGDKLIDFASLDALPVPNVLPADWTKFNKEKKEKAALLKLEKAKGKKKTSMKVMKAMKASVKVVKTMKVMKRVSGKTAIEEAKTAVEEEVDETPAPTVFSLHIQRDCFI